MDSQPAKVQPLSIRARLVLALAAVTAFAGGGVLLWSADAQKEAAIEQAREFAQGVHQLTLAGLTAMMMTNTQSQRALFLDQIEQANGVRSLRVLRAPVVAQQYGPGTAREQPTDALERQVLADGKAVYQLGQDANERPYLKAVIPAVGSTNFLGKNCLGCHHVPEGTVLGATTLEISLEKPQAAAAQFQKGLLQVATAFFGLFALLAWIAVSRSVSEPLRTLARRLDDIAEGRVDEQHRLPARGADEIADASAAFNRVMDKAAEMLKAERVASDVFANALEGIVVTDRDARILRVNPAFTRTTGYSAEEAVGRTPAMLQSGQHDQEFYREFWRALTTTGEWRGDIWNKRKNGEVYPEWLNISCVRNERGEIESYVGIFSDITERKRQEALITHQAHHDALTGLPNRILYKDRLEQALSLARRKGSIVGVMFLDLDRFKHINDTLGHDVGDELLKEVARRLRGSVREADTVARLGGDEFTVLLPDLDGPAGAQAVAQKILEATKQTYRLAGQDLHVTTSIGIALYPRHGTDAEALMKNADTAMYSIKEQGRAGARLYDPTLGERLAHDAALERALHRALERGELRVGYQPQRSLGSDRITGVEALLRWDHPELGELRAREFLEVAEETGLIVPIGEWVLQTACREAAHWAREARPLTVTVNLSARQFENPALAATVSRALQQSGLAPELLELEITESQAMHNVERTIATFRTLARLGVRLAVAEFGTGFHSMADDLKRMPIDGVKIDRSLVRNLALDPEAFRIVSSIAQNRHDGRLKVVAVGVESREQMEILRTMRCDTAQGRYVGMALSAAEIGALARRLADAGLRARV